MLLTSLSVKGCGKRNMVSGTGARFSNFILSMDKEFLRMAREESPKEGLKKAVPVQEKEKKDF